MGRLVSLTGFCMSLMSVSAAANDSPKGFWMKVENEYRLGEIVVSEANVRIFMTCQASSYPLDEASLTPAVVGCPEDPFFSVAKIIKIDSDQSSVTVSSEDLGEQQVSVKTTYMNHFQLDDRALIVRDKSKLDRIDIYALAQDEYDGRSDRNASPLFAMSQGSIIGVEVFNEQGDAVGEIADLIKSVENGSILGAVLSVGGFLGIGDKHVAVPLDVFRLTRDNRIVYADITAEKLEQMRSYQEEEYAPAERDRGEALEKREPSG